MCVFALTSAFIQIHHDTYPRDMCSYTEKSLNGFISQNKYDFQTLNSRISSFSFQVKPLKVTISSSTSVIAVSVTEVPALCVIEWSWNIDFYLFIYFCGNSPLSSKRRAA